MSFLTDPHTETIPTNPDVQQSRSLFVVPDGLYPVYEKNSTVFKSDSAVNIVNLKTEQRECGDNISGLIFDYRSFKELILKETVPVAVVAVMMVGLPDCGKSTLLKEVLQKQIKLKDSDSVKIVQSHMNSTSERGGLSFYELCTIGSSRYNQYAWSFTSRRQGITYCAIASILRKMKNSILTIDQVKFQNKLDDHTNDAQFAVGELNQHLQWVYDKAEHQFEKIKDDHHKLELLSSGLALVNIFDAGVNKAVYDFLPYLAYRCKHLIRLVAFSMKRDAGKLFSPPSLMDVEDYVDRHRSDHLVMRWRSRMNYLLHFASLGHYPGLGTANHITSGKTIFIGVWPWKQAGESELLVDEDVDKNNQQSFKMAKEEILRQTESKKMNWITSAKHWIEIKDINSLQQASTEVQQLISKSSEYHTRMPLKWLFLRSLVSSYTSMQETGTFSRKVGKLIIVDKVLLRNFAGELEIVGNELEEFLEFFSSFGSLVPVNCANNKQYIIVNVLEFTRLVSKLYYPEQNGVEEVNKLHKEFGIVAKEKILCLLSYAGNSEEFMDIMIELGMAARVKNPLNPEKKKVEGIHYYIPYARTIEPQSREAKKKDSAVLVIESVNFPANVQASLAHCISNSRKVSSSMIFTETSNITTFILFRPNFMHEELEVEVELMYCGKETEFRIKSVKGEDDHVALLLSDLLEDCSRALNEWQQFRRLYYNIGFRCIHERNKGEIHYFYSDSDPEQSSVCGDCYERNDSNMEYWKHAIKMCDNAFKRHGKDRLNHDDKLKLEDFTLIAKELVKLDDKKFSKLLKELDVSKPQQKDNWRYMFQTIIEWEKNLESQTPPQVPSKQKLIEAFQKLDLQELALLLDTYDH